MAGGAVLVDQDRQRVPVTVGGNGDDMLIIAGGFTFAPELLAGAAPEAGFALLHGDLQTLPVHVGQSQHFLGDSIHHNGGNQPFFIKF